MKFETFEIELLRHLQYLYKAVLVNNVDGEDLETLVKENLEDTLEVVPTTKFRDFDFIVDRRFSS